MTTETWAYFLRPLSCAKYRSSNLAHQSISYLFTYWPVKTEVKQLPTVNFCFLVQKKKISTIFFCCKLYRWFRSFSSFVFQKNIAFVLIKCSFWECLSLISHDFDGTFQQLFLSTKQKKAGREILFFAAKQHFEYNWKCDILTYNFH